MQEEEVILTGFCKMQNQTRMVICEVAYGEKGEIEVLSSDCAYGACSHTKDCLLMGRIAESAGK